MKFRYYVVFWSRPIGSGPASWTPSAQVVDRDSAIETADDIGNLATSLATQHGEFVLVVDWKRLQ